MTFISRTITTLMSLGLAAFGFADDHADAPKALPMALWSTYEFRRAPSPVISKPHWLST